MSADVFRLWASVVYTIVLFVLAYALLPPAIFWWVFWIAITVVVSLAVVLVVLDHWDSDRDVDWLDLRHPSRRRRENSK